MRRRRYLYVVLIALMLVALLGITRKISTIIGMPFGLAMSLNYLPPWSEVHKFGRRGDIDTPGEVPATSWICPDINASIHDAYIYDTAAAVTVHVSSDNEDDAGLTLMIEGLDEDWAKRAEPITLGADTLSGGTAMVASTDEFWRIFRAYNTSDTDFAGNIYVTTVSTDADLDGVPDDLSGVRACIPIGRGQTLQAVYTIPAGHTGHLLNVCMGVSAVSTSAVELAALQFMVRREGGVFRVQQEWGITSRGTSVDCRAFPSPLAYPEKTDMEIRAITVGSNNTEIHGDFTVWLEEN